MSAAARIAALAILLGALAWLLVSGTRLVNDPEDFRAFYCAGRTVLAHADPYLAEPLRTCEVREAIAAGLSPYRDLAIPAPLPGYALAPFALVALLPFAAAGSLETILLIVAVAVTVLLLAKLVPAAPLGIAAALALGDGLVSITNGQIVPFAVLALCACAFEVRRGGYRSACLYAALASIEPHVALPAWCSLAYALPKTRLPLGIAAAGLAALSLATLGLHQNIEYVLHVLPAHARSELTASGQYSLTTALARAGANAGAAVAAGNACYVGATLVGVIVARRIAQRLDAPECLVLVPPAFALFGGPFVHLTQMAVAVPALLVLDARLPRLRRVLRPALLLLALPWLDLAENPPLAASLAIAAVTAAIATTLWKLSAPTTAAIVAAAVALGLGERALRVSFAAAPVDATAVLAPLAQGDRLAEATWSAFIALTQRAPEPMYLLSHLPTWLGLAGGIAAAVAAARRATPSRGT